ncbi:MBL fold metallo-hydrolase [Micromonospora sp. DR5-3]|uniref:MBL fold metallo-hydrolase n=1 Tax=unclassified Micromonospora TaxID=2617518 RepID=UPI0011D563BC|nr:MULTISPECIES: MBL fold metallo-hydrolase [unclassified Micromonospora]MCW3814154.1 MBL fold metallo-hydrolase [Micromonospora sp. DR5-3]TYC25038.1 MBL fold metallo-hydrolase [Micromonospora sp. MP36]
MSSERLHPRLYRLLLGAFQAYLWLDDDGVTLVDTGPAGSGPAIEASLRDLGLGRADLRRVVLTHFHDDHAGAAAEVAAWGDVEVVAHAADAPVLRGERPGPPPAFTEAERDLHARVAAGLPPAPPVRVDREVTDRDLLDFGGGAEVVGTPGHTDGSVALHLPRHRLLFTGDVAAEYGGEVIFGVFHVDRARAAESFRRLAALDVDLACFGHGEPVLGGAGDRLRAAAGTLAED